MAHRGRFFISRMLFTFCDLGGSSRGTMAYLQRHGQELKERVETNGGQFAVEVRRNSHPEIRLCYFHGTHLNTIAQNARTAAMMETSELRWRRPPTSARRRERMRMFRELEVHGALTHGPEAERRHLQHRIQNMDTVAGQAENRRELEEHIPPDVNGDRYSFAALLDTQAALPYKPYDWPLWKVWGPSGKTVNLRSLNPKEVAEHVWWLLRTTGGRSSGWGNNVPRHIVARPSVQGPWTPRTAADLNLVQFHIHESIEVPYEGQLQ